MKRRQLIGASFGLPTQRSVAVHLTRRERVFNDVIEDWDTTHRRWRTEVDYRVAEIVDYQEDPDQLAERAAGWGDATKVVDVTRVGRTVTEALSRRRVRVMPLLLYDGLERVAARWCWKVPTSEAFGRLVTAASQGRIRIAAAGGEELRQALVELGAEGAPDPAVVALAVAIWRGEGLGSQVHQPHPPRLPIELPRAPTFDEAVRDLDRRRAER